MRNIELKKMLNSENMKNKKIDMIEYELLKTADSYYEELKIRMLIELLKEELQNNKKVI